MARPTLFTHRKFARLGRLLGANYKAVGVLELVWRVAHECGDPVVGTPEDVEWSVGWDGEPGACASALVEAGFLDELEGGQLAVHDLDDHAPQYVKDRRRKEEQRRRKKEQAQEPDPCPGTVPGQSRDNHGTVQDNPGTITGQSRDCPTTPAPAPAPTPTPIEEEPPNGGSCPELAASSGPAAEEEAFLVFPCVGDAREWTLTRAKVDEYQESYPHLDVEAQARAALQWIRDNAANRKTARGMVRFLNGWMGRAQNQGRGGGRRGRSSPEARLEEKLAHIPEEYHNWKTSEPWLDDQEEAANGT